MRTWKGRNNVDAARSLENEGHDGTARGLDDEGEVAVVFDDPLSELPEVARNLLLAAKRIVADEGLTQLSLNSVSELSGENKAMVSYYFGGKAGLIAAVLDSVIHDDYLASVARVKGTPAGERPRRLVEEMRALGAATEDFRVFFELLPVALRDPKLRVRIARLYEWYRNEKLEWLGADEGLCDPDDPAIVGLSQLLSAFIDGLAVQAAADPGLDLSPAYDVLLSMIEARFGTVEGAREGREGA